MTIEFGPPREDADPSALGGILGWAFGFELGEAGGRLEPAGEPASHARLGALLAGPAPAMVDYR